MRTRLLLFAAGLVAPSIACSTPGPPTDSEPDVSAATPEAALPEPFWDEDAQRLLLRIDRLGAPLLHVVSLPQGLGSNDVGLDRGQLGTTRLVEFRAAGGRILLVAPNLDWRSSSPDPLVRDGTQRAFASSILASFEPLEDGPSDGRWIDVTKLWSGDAHGVADALDAAGQGSFRIDPERTLLLPDTLASFPANLHIDCLQTFSGDDPGREVRSTTPAPESVSLRVRHALIALPEDDAYRPRTFHPRSGYFARRWNDAAAPLGADTLQRVITRHHVTPDHPLVYYIDRAAPEPMRTALVEGARFWEPIFDAAVFPGAFRVELLPEDADPDDLRWNIVQWVERSTRGWSYGNSVVDPRTGRILKGHVTLGALRIRQDVTLFEGLLGPYADGEQDPAVLEAALARLRQLSAHEIGHTLGLAHNFAASTDERASVMDYPAPRVTLDASGTPDLSDAYAPACGAWDAHAIRYGYGLFEDEPAGLATTLAELEASGLRYASDVDARGADRAHPVANLWDEGRDPVAQLALDLAVRAAALERYGAQALAPERSLFDLERTLVPLYLRHRYQLEAVVRQLGGRWYGYPLADPSDQPSARTVTAVAADAQLRALDAALGTLEPEVLALPEALVASLVPPPPGYGRDRETFSARGPLFDPLEAAAAAADLALGLLLEPTRCARLVDQRRADPAQPGLDLLLDRLIERWFEAAPAGAPEVAALEEVVATRLFEHLLRLADPGRAAARVRGPVLTHLNRIETALAISGRNPDLLLDLRRYREHPESLRGRPATPRVPPGSPIGSPSGMSFATPEFHLDCGAPPLQR